MADNPEYWSTSGATLIGVILLIIKEILYVGWKVLENRGVKINFNSCCGLFKGDVEVTEDEAEETPKDLVKDNVKTTTSSS
jgi:hypothetical protein